MPAVTPLPQENAPAEIQEIYDKLTGKFGRMPNIFGTMARRPGVLDKFLPLYAAIINEGTVEAKFK